MQHGDEILRDTGILESSGIGIKCLIDTSKSRRTTNGVQITEVRLVYSVFEKVDLTERLWREVRAVERSLVANGTLRVILVMVVRI